MESVGQAFEPNLEEIAALEPDLIVVLEQVYEELSQIAPTVGVRFGDSSGEWERYNRAYTEALGKDEEFEASGCRSSGRFRSPTWPGSTSTRASSRRCRAA